MKTNNREKDKKSNCDNYRISISCRSSVDNRNKVKGKNVSGDVIKGPLGHIRATRAIGSRRAVTCKSIPSSRFSLAVTIRQRVRRFHTNAMTLERRMGSVTCSLDLLHSRRHMANNLLIFNQLHSHRPASATGFVKSNNHCIMS